MHEQEGDQENRPLLDGDSTTDSAHAPDGDNADGKQSSLSEEEEADLRDVFYMFDLDHNGTISHKELCVVLRALGATTSSRDGKAVPQPITEEETRSCIKEAEGAYEPRDACLAGRPKQMLHWHVGH